MYDPSEYDPVEDGVYDDEEYIAERKGYDSVLDMKVNEGWELTLEEERQVFEDEIDENGNFRCEFITDCEGCNYSNNLKNCGDCDQCSNCSSCSECNDCKDCIDCYKCEGCSYCYDCADIQNLSYMWSNEQLTKDEWYKRLEGYYHKQAIETVYKIAHNFVVLENKKQINLNKQSDERMVING